MLAVCVMALLASLALRLVQLQVVRGGRLQTIAARQRLATIPLQPRRGRLLDRRGRPLAINVEATSVYAVPISIPNRAAFAARIAPILGIHKDEVVRRLQGGRHFVWLARKVRPEVIAKLKSADLGDQIGFRIEDRRAYPGGSSAAHLLGFVGIDNQGLAGIELAYDHRLRGIAGEAVAAHDGIGRILVETQRTVQPPVDGADLLLTIDQVIQHIAERELDAAMTRTRSRAGSVIVMDARTGEILALAGRPAFDPNAGVRAAPHLWLNRAVSEMYEPGSTFKVFLTAAALDSGLLSPEDRFFCNGSLRIGGHVVRDGTERTHGWQTVRDVVKNSCNIGSAQMATRLGKPTFYRYIRAFGFGESTRIDLPGEVGGMVRAPSGWLGPGLATISFGQGISVTSLQLLSAAAALANDGLLLRPFVVRGVRDAQGRMTEVAGTQPARRVIQPEVAREVLHMMTTAVDEGTGIRARIEGYAVAGKTGTAQKPAPGGGYAPGRYVASFLGIVPADQPRLAILVMLDQPVGAYYGGEIAAPVFREVAAQTLWYLRVPPKNPF